jgi:D-alanyl-D-alanine carboxypeptidase
VQAWIGAAADYVGAALAHQVREMDTAGCVLAIAHAGHLVYERAYGAADIRTGEATTGRHRIRVASLSRRPSPLWAYWPKPVAWGWRMLSARTCPACMRRSRRQRLPSSFAILPHYRAMATAPVVWRMSYRFPLVTAFAMSFRGPPTIAAGLRFKCSNDGMPCWGSVSRLLRASRAITGSREVIAASGLRETTPDLHEAGAPIAPRGFGATSAWAIEPAC